MFWSSWTGFSHTPNSILLQTCLGSPAAALQWTECCGHSVSMWEKGGWACGRKGKVTISVTALAWSEVQNRLHKREVGPRTAILQYPSQSIPFQLHAVSVYSSQWRETCRFFSLLLLWFLLIFLLYHLHEIERVLKVNFFPFQLAWTIVWIGFSPRREIVIMYLAEVPAAHPASSVNELCVCI